MSRYETSMPRLTLGVVAIALTGVTFALTVLLPASVYSERANDASTTLAKSAAPRVIEVAIIPSRIDVTAPCEQAMAYEPPRRAQHVGGGES